MTRLATLFVLLMLVAPATRAQQVHVVDDAGGPGSDFSALQPAFDAAADGDIVLVRTGNYSGAAITGGKSLSVLADAGASVQVDGRLRIVGAPPGTTSTFKGLVVTGEPDLDQVAFQAKACGGALWIESCTFTGSAANGFSSPAGGASLELCADVVFVRCDVSAGGTLGASTSGTFGLTAEAADVWAFESTFTGTNGTSSGGGSAGFPGGDGARLEAGSSLFATACTFTGGHGGNAVEDFDIFCGCFVCGSAGDGGSAVALVDSALTEQASVFTPGFAGAPLGSSCGPGDDGQAVRLDGASSSTALPGATRGLRMTPLAREGETVQFAANGAEGELVWWLVGLQGDSLYLPGKASPLLLELPIVLSLPLVPVPAGGLLTLDFVAPALPVGLDAVTLRSQAFFAAPGGGQLANMASTFLLDAGL